MHHGQYFEKWEYRRKGGKSGPQDAVVFWLVICILLSNPCAIKHRETSMRQTPAEVSWVKQDMLEEVVGLQKETMVWKRDCGPVGRPGQLEKLK